MDENFYLGLADELDAKLRRISSFVKHGPSIGDYHEEALKSVIETMLPSRFKIRTGFAYTLEKGASQQGDILIIDENDPDAYFFKEGDFVVANPSAVVCVIEVKTTLTKKTFKEALVGLQSFNRVSPPRVPFTFLFAYEAPKFSFGTLTNWYDSITEIADELPNYPVFIMALNQGVIMLQAPRGGLPWGHLPIEGETTRGPKLRALSMFLQGIKKTLLMHCKSNAPVFDRARLDGLRKGVHIYRFGSGGLPSAKPYPP